MAPAFSDYVRTIERALVAGHATEPTHRRALQDFIESLESGVTATNEPTHVECGAPDLLVSRNGVTVGYLETKDVGASLDREERSQQLQRYRGALSNLILTDYLEFRWYVDGECRQTVSLGSATSEGKITRSRSGSRAVADLFRQFFAQQPPAIGRPDELARRMAGLARMIRDLIRETFARETERGRLHAQLNAFRDTLIPDLAPDQFADMYAQTITYGLFAARVRVGSGQAFTRQSAAWNLPETNPFLRKLFNQIAGPGLDSRIAWLVGDLARLLARADMVEILQDFGRRIRQEDPVVHFYETFLGAYDPKTRRTRGVYYTPEPVVSYIVRSLDHLLRTRFGRAWGLADTNTLVLDPACGTGTFLYFVIRRIHETLEAMGQLGTWGDYVKSYLLPRLFGFELLMAPYAMAHMKLALLLEETGYDFSGDQRLGIYLTNTLEEAVTQAETLGFAGFITEEGNAAAEIKRDKPIMVVLGNPPYSVSSANKGEHIERLMERYKAAVRGERNIQPLSDDYIKFIRFAHDRIERTGYGVIGMITNHSYLSGLIHRGMREELLKSFSEVYILNLHGSALLGETAPDGSKDENVFDIRQGVVIALYVKKPGHDGAARVNYADLWGLRRDKYRWLVDTDADSTEWQALEPVAPYFFFVPKDFELLSEYEQGWTVAHIFPTNTVGVVTSRDRIVTDFGAEPLRARIATLRDKTVLDSQVAEALSLKDTSTWKLREARASLFGDQAWHTHFTHCLYRPFDVRSMYYHDALIERSRRETMTHMLRRNVGLVCTRQITVPPFNHVTVANRIVEYKCASTDRNCYLFPLYLHSTREHTGGTLFAAEGVTREPNLSPAFIAEMERRLGMTFVPDGKGDLEATFGPEDVFNYIYALLHSPTYRERYAEFLKIDFPRVPLTTDRDLFAALADRGHELVGLHLMESPQLDRLITGFPVVGDNQVERVRYSEPRLDDDGNQLAGRVYINKTQCFEGVSPKVWEFRVGGYQVCHKWLKDRTGRQLSFDDLLHYQKIVLALRETIRLMAQIDEVIEAHDGWPIA